MTMNFNSKGALQIALTILLLATVLALSLSGDFYTSSMVNPYLSLALFSSLIVLGVLRRSWLDLLWVVAGGLSLAFLDYRVIHFQFMPMACFSFTGLAAFARLGACAIWAKGEDRKLLLYGFLPMVLFVGSEWMASTLLDITERLHPKTFDLFLLSFDCSLRVQISFLVGQLLSKWHWLWWMCIVFYTALPLPLALVYSAQLRRAKSDAMAAMLAFLVTGPIGVIFYNILPACGPVHLFGPAFPWHPLSAADSARVLTVPILLRGARNAIPSLHMTWVLLVWWNSKGLARWVRAIAGAFVWFTVLATLGTGEHYFIDLVVAFPFSLMVQALCSYPLPFRAGARRAAFLFGMFATLVWFAVLSFAVHIFWISSLIPWSTIGVTVAASVVLWHRLLRAESPASEPVRSQAAAAGATA